MGEAELERELVALADLNWPQLRKRWSALTGGPAPQVKPKLLRLALAWELQAACHGGLARRTGQRLDQLANAKTSTRDARPGTQLVREWNGVLHIVTVDANSAIRWNGRTWRSLSAVARAITGTRWSGPAFFGLKQKACAA